VAEHCSITTSKNSGHPAPVFAEDWMPNGVNAGMDSMEASRIQPMFDRAATEAEIEQLSARDHMMLGPS
jgi:hypothetical protein